MQRRQKGPIQLSEKKNESTCPSRMHFSSGSQAADTIPGLHSTKSCFVLSCPVSYPSHKDQLTMSVFHIVEVENLKYRCSPTSCIHSQLARRYKAKHQEDLTSTERCSQQSLHNLPLSFSHIGTYFSSKNPGQ